MTTSYFDRLISVFASVKEVNHPEHMTLRDFLTGEFLKRRGQWTEVRATINHMRKLDRSNAEEDAEYKRLKKTIPCATISGKFVERKSDYLTEHSGLICIDVDKKPGENEGKTTEELRAIVTSCPFVCYAGHSIGGAGIFAIIPIAFPLRHKDQFRALQRDFAENGVTIDSACSDLARCRVWSFEQGSEPYINESAEVYKEVYTEPRPVFQRHEPRHYQSQDETVRKVYEYCYQLRDAHAADSYQSWVYEIGMPLASEGERYRQAFHIASQGSTKYNKAECDRKFTSLMHSVQKIGLGTFIYNAKQMLGQW